MKSILIGIFVGVIFIFSNTGLSAQKAFSNPLLKMGPDPWMIYHEGFYYYTNTLQNRIEIWKTKNPANLADAQNKRIWQTPDTGMYSAEIWAPEIHFLDGSWYVYFAADDGKNSNHRMWVLTCDSKDPMTGNWSIKGKLSDPGDHWAIDGSILEHNGQRYFIWSGWETHENIKQDIYIAEMENPWTLKGERMKISSPEAAWELNGLSTDSAANVKDVFVNEGPQELRNGDDLFIIFSANGCWTDYYALGFLKLSSGGNVMNPDDWKKSEGPIFQTSEENKVYAPGHNSFFKSPDGTEDWILYHANPKPGQGCGRHRSPRAQKIEWNQDGYPVLGAPLPLSEKIPFPSGVE